MEVATTDSEASEVQASEASLSSGLEGLGDGEKPPENTKEVLVDDDGKGCVPPGCRGNAPRRPTNLSFVQKVIGGSGHILNDLCASLWFTYFLLYMQKVARFTDRSAAALMLLGQIVDGVSTPLIGLAVDKINNCCLCKKGYGRCKSWHLIGVILIVISFPFIFSPCIGCEHTDEWARAIYYAPFIVIFQIGWASCQISHLALIPKMTMDILIRTEVLAIRYAFTVMANIAVFLMTWITLGFEDCDINPQDAPYFQFLALVSVGIGGTFALLFHLFVMESTDQEIRRASLQSDVDKLELVAKGTSQQSLSSGKESVTVCEWLRMPQFYIVAVMYMGTRLSVNITQAYMPLYLEETLRLPCGSVAYIPLTMFCSGFVVSLFIKLIHKYLGRQLAYGLGAALCVTGGVLILCFPPGTALAEKGIYGIAVLLGGGASAILVTSLSITADLIGNNVESGAFVYGAMSFCDKLPCGLAVMLINELKVLYNDRGFYQRVLGYTAGSCSTLGVLGVVGLTFLLYNKKNTSQL